MKRHIIGLAIFSFIVSAAAVVYGVINLLFPVPDSVFVVSPQYVPAERTHCKMRVKSKKHSIEVRQAVFSVGRKQFDFEIAAPEDSGVIALHIYSKNNTGTHHVETVQVGNVSDNGKIKLTVEAFDWLDKNKSDKNFFVVAERISEYIYFDKDTRPEFDSKKATPVTVDYGK